MENSIILGCLVFSIVVSMLMKKAIDFDIKNNIK